MVRCAHVGAAANVLLREEIPDMRPGSGWYAHLAAAATVVLGRGLVHEMTAAGGMTETAARPGEGLDRAMLRVTVVFSSQPAQDNCLECLGLGSAIMSSATVPLARKGRAAYREDLGGQSFFCSAAAAASSQRRCVSARSSALPDDPARLTLASNVCILGAQASGTSPLHDEKLSILRQKRPSSWATLPARTIVATLELHSLDGARAHGARRTTSPDVLPSKPSSS